MKHHFALCAMKNNKKVIASITSFLPWAFFIPADLTTIYPGKISAERSEGQNPTTNTK